MFIGHYGVSFALKKKVQQIPLWLLFIAVQWVDILFFSFVLIGVENLRIIPGFTAYNPYDLYNMPFTHSLLGSLVCSLIFGFVAAAFLRKRMLFAKAVLWLSLAAFSHFVLDLPMHVKDMLLWPGSDVHLGFGLWNHFYASMAIEAIILALGLWYYGIKNRRYPFWILFVLLWAMLIFTPFMPPPGSVVECAITGLVAYLVFVGLAACADRS